MSSSALFFRPVNGLDALDRAILRMLQEDGRITNAELAARIGLTAAPTLGRVRRLERDGFIRKYVALVDPAKLGKPVTAFVAVIMKSHGQQADASFRRAVAKLPEVLECHHIAGEEDYLLKVVAASPTDYERFVLGRLLKVPAIEKVKTTFVLSSSKVDTRIPVEPEG
jgi:DNA-binding Lrp family transcriptional regulator